MAVRRLKGLYLKSEGKYLEDYHHIARAIQMRPLSAHLHLV